jgi:phage baseplate assembly protein gpV
LIRLQGNTKREYFLPSVDELVYVILPSKLGRSRFVVTHFWVPCVGDNVYLS